jgi:predicted phosphodiesterase
MIYLISDQHGGETIGEFNKYLDIATDSDLLISLGDVGLKFEDTKVNRAFDEILLSTKKKIAIIDGNHENFKYLFSFPKEEWQGGTVYRITPNLVVLERGNIYEINGKTFFVFGSAKSSDKWKDLGLWQPEEEPTKEQLNRAYENLKKHNFKVDYVLMHKREYGIGLRYDSLLTLCNFIEEKVDFKHFYSGHVHIAGQVDSKHTLVYDKLIELQ